MADVKLKVDAGVVNARKSKQYSQESEAWAVGKKDGVDVPNTADQYHNNSKYYKEIAMSAAATATNMEYNAGQDALNSEAYAVGKRNGSDVTSGDPAYHNNSKYFAIEAWGYSGDAENAKIDAVSAKNAAASSKLDSEAYAVGKRNGSDVTSGDPAYHNNSKYYSGEASNSASSASSSASTATSKAQDSEAYAVGKRGGVDVTSGDPAYHNNSKYYSAQAASSATAASGSATAAASSATAAAASASAIAATYDSTKTYAVGEYCLYNGGMYVCTTAITVAEAWTAGHWSAVKVGTELTALKEDIDNVFVPGVWAIADGEAVAHADYCRTASYIGDDVQSVVIAPTAQRLGNIWLFVLAYTTDNEYVGTWDETNHTFIKTYDMGKSLRNSQNIEYLRKLYPTYKFKVCAQSTISRSFAEKVGLIELIKKDDFSEAYANHTLKLETGLWAVANGKAITDNNSWVRTPFYIPLNCSISYATAVMVLLAYDNSGNYIGAWDTNSNTFTSAYSASLLVKDIDMYAFAKAYPNYKFKITINEGQTTEYVTNKIHISFNDTNIYKLVSDVSGLYNAVNDSVYSTFIELESGYWGVADGLPASSLYWARSTGYVPKGSIVIVPNKYSIALLAYDNNGTYIGTWDANNRAFTKTYDYSLLLQVVNVASVSVQHPHYRFKISINDANLMDIDDLKNSISVNDVSLANQSGDIIPTYYISHMETKNASIKDNINAVGKNGETFVFITDIHWENNYRNSPSLVKNVLDNTNVRLLLCGGDLINTAAKATAEGLIQACVKAFDFSGYPMHTAFGNHDANSLNWPTVEEETANTFSGNEIFGLTQKNSSFANDYITDNGINFYFDRGDSKTRFIFLDSGTDSTYPSGTISALCNTLNSTPSGYKIVIVQHWYFNGVTPQTATLTTTAQTLMSIVKQYNDRGSYTYGGETYNFANAVGNVFLLLGGHTHYDYVLDADDENNIAGVPIVCTADDSWRDRTITSGTITEQCFDVITLDYDNRVIKCVRIGDGSDRTISY